MATAAAPLPHPTASAASRAAGASAAVRAASPAVQAALGLAGAAWVVSVLLQVTGHAGALHHHALIEDGGPPLAIAIPLFLVAWQLMIAAMMLPASLRAVRIVAGSRFVAEPWPALAGFLGAYSLVWTGFGLVAFVGDFGLHSLVDATPWLAARPWLIQASVLAIAGAYQLVPLRRRALDACRHPGADQAREGGSAKEGGSARGRGSARVGFAVGLAHALDCLICSWAVMLLMFAAGLANLAWMAILAAVMAYEVSGRDGRLVSPAFGIGLLALAGLAASGVWLGF